MPGTIRKFYSGQVLESLGLKGDAALARAIDVDTTSSTPVDRHGGVRPSVDPVDATEKIVPGSPTATITTGTGGISLTGAGVASLQDFDTLASTGTSATLPAGWYFSETGTAENATYLTGTGSATTGDTYSFGAASATDRAFGTLLSGSLTATIGAQFTNNTGGAIGSLAIAFTGEQWRLGTAGRVDRLDFEISFNATSLTTGTWTAVDQLDFTAPVTTGPLGSLNGNSAANQTAVSYTYALASALASGATFWIRWVDFNGTSSDDGLAIDNFSITPIAATAPLPTLSINDVTLNEGNAGTTSYTFTVNLSAPAPAGGVTFDIATADGTATAGSDYTQMSLTSQTIPAGSSTYSFTVLVNGDTAVEPNESFFVNVTNVTGATVTDGQGQGTIVNDDASPVPVVSASSPSIVEGNSGTSNLVFTVSLNQASTDTVTVAYTTADGTALAGSDYSATSGTVTFLPGETSKTVNVAISGDTVFEASETFAFNLSAPTNATLGTSGTGTITNDDTAPTLAISGATVTEGNSGTTILSYTVTLSGSTALTTTVNYATANGTATAGSDYVATNGTLTFAPGETSKTINVTVNGDTTFEANETVLVNLTAPTNATIVTAQGTGTITNDDAVPPPANIWINEIHYDNAGTDAGEAIEIAGVAGTDLTGYTLVLYNGTNTPGAAPTYTPVVNLTGVIDNEGGSGYGALAFNVAGLQNGANDGFALVSPSGVVIQLLSYEGVFTAAAGTPAGGITSIDIGVSEDGSGALGTSLQLTGNGAAGADFTWQPDSTSSFGSLNVGQTIIPDNATGQVSVRDASVVEGNAGTTNLVFTISRAGGLGSAATVDYTINLDGTATSDDLGVGAVLTGTVSFAVGAYTATVTIPIQGDTVGEANETLSLLLSNPVGNIAITDATGIGTIVNDDFVTLTIAQIQGAGHTSSYVGQPVQTTGIVTAVDTNGFYLQMAVGDGNAATSDAIFVFTSTAPTVVVGNGVTVGGTVVEFVGAAGALSLTQISSPTVTVTSAVNALPAAVLIGTGGILPPSQQLDDDGLTVFDPANDGLDFWESLEGMRVTLDAPQVVSNTNSFGETDVVVSHGVGATGVNDRGGITISPNSDGTVDYNPEKIQIDDDSGVFSGFNPNYTIGDQLSSITGIVNYAFNYYEVIVTAAVTITQDVTLARETTTIRGNSDYLTLATYNLENLDPSDNKYSILASDIVYNLRAPDILAVQEVQDADGAGTGGNLSGVSNAQGIIDAIFTLTGMHYAYIEVAPTTANTTGGEPNGNIRNGYFYNIDRVSYVAGSAVLIDGAAYNNSRKPLVATFTFQGQDITTINVHSTSRGGSEPLQGADQPADAAGDGQRTAQAAGVKAYVNAALASNPNLNIAVLGDWNGFYFEQAQTQLTDPTQGGMLTNANYLLTPEERYSYVFEGNSQQIDNILVSGNLLAKLAAGQYDAVHLNSEFGGTRPTDHDPQIVTFKFGNGVADSLFGTDQDDTYIVDNAGDRVYENVNGGNDTINASIDYDLNNAPNVENLTFTGTADLVGTGTSGNNVLRGNAGDNRFFGGGGTDTFYGGDGDDFFIIDSADDVVIELFDQGYDTIKSSVSYTLAAGSYVDVLRLTGTNNNSATGNAFANSLLGNPGDNTLDGGGGGDALRGGFGNDTYIIRDATDVIVEAANTGVADVAKAAVSYTINAGAWVETLETIDALATTAIDLGGNSHTTTLRGNAGVNHLTSGAGNEAMYGLGGADVFVFLAAVGQDVVGDFVSGTDKLDLQFYFADFAAFQAATNDVGGNAVINLGGGQTVTLLGVTEAQVQSGDVYTMASGGGLASDRPMIDIDARDHLLFADYWGSAVMPIANHLV